MQLAQSWLTSSQNQGARACRTCPTSSGEACVRKAWKMREWLLLRTQSPKQWLLISLGRSTCSAPLQLLCLEPVLRLHSETTSSLRREAMLEFSRPQRQSSSSSESSTGSLIVRVSNSSRGRSWWGRCVDLKFMESRVSLCCSRVQCSLPTTSSSSVLMRTMPSSNRSLWRFTKALEMMRAFFSSSLVLVTVRSKSGQGNAIRFGEQLLQGCCRFQTMEPAAASSRCRRQKKGWVVREWPTVSSRQYSWSPNAIDRAAGAEGRKASLAWLGSSRMAARHSLGSLGRQRAWARQVLPRRAQWQLRGWAVGVTIRRQTGQKGLTLAQPKGQAAGWKLRLRMAPASISQEAKKACPAWESPEKERGRSEVQISPGKSPPSANLLPSINMPIKYELQDAYYKSLHAGFVQAAQLPPLQRYPHVTLVFAVPPAVTYHVETVPQQVDVFLGFCWRGVLGLAGPDGLSVVVLRDGVGLRAGGGLLGGSVLDGLREETLNSFHFNLWQWGHHNLLVQGETGETLVGTLLDLAAHFSSSFPQLYVHCGLFYLGLLPVGYGFGVNSLALPGHQLVDGLRSQRSLVLNPLFEVAADSLPGEFIFQAVTFEFLKQNVSVFEVQFLLVGGGSQGGHLCPESLILLEELVGLVLEVVEFVVEFPDLILGVFLGDGDVEGLHRFSRLLLHFCDFVFDDGEDFGFVIFQPSGDMVVDGVNDVVDAVVMSQHALFAFFGPVQLLFGYQAGPWLLVPANRRVVLLNYGTANFPHHRLLLSLFQQDSNCSEGDG